jgi:hypothetical protein
MTTDGQGGGPTDRYGDGAGIPSIGDGRYGDGWGEGPMGLDELFGGADSEYGVTTPAEAEE